jgi:hypothetical protein
MDIMVTPHMDDGSPEPKWRNAIALDPLKKYGEWSYSEALVSPAALVGGGGGAVGAGGEGGEGGGALRAAAAQARAVQGRGFAG